jgi:hypothetical protein
METDELIVLANQWDNISRSSPLANGQRSAILLKLRQGTPERSAYMHVRFFGYLEKPHSRDIYMRILQSEAERSEAP